MTCELNVEDCDRILKNFLNSDDVITRTFTLDPLENENFILKITTYHEQNKKNVTFFAKTKGVSQIFEIFQNIEKLIPKFDLSFTSKLYHANSNLAIFEDLKAQGFEKIDELLNLNQLFVALKILAKLHGGSFAFEETKSGKFRLDKEFALLHLNLSMRSSQAFNILSKFLDEEKVKEVIEDLEDRQFSSKFRRTLCHGNLSSKNIMFKYEKGVPLDCKLINMNSNFYAPPIYDVLQLVFFNTSEDLRQHHFQTLLNHYYECLKEEIKKYDLDLDGILPFEDYQLSFHHVLPVVKLENVLLGKEESIEDLKEVFNNPLISKEDCYVIIKNKLGTTNYKFLFFEVTPLDNVSGFLGEYHKLQIKLQHLSQEKIINCFIKCPPKSGTPQALAQHLSSFSREAFMYHILVPQMVQYGITTINECLSPCYFLRQEELMVFEDMSLLNYKTLDALRPLDFSYVGMLIKKLARFHSCSLILEEKITEENQKPFRIYDTYRRYFDEPLFLEDVNHLGAKQFITGIKSVLAAAELLDEIKTETNQKNFKKSWKKFRDLFYEVIKPSKRFRNVLCHGDLWTSNMMVKFENDQPIGCILIDFQIIRCCPPAYDILSVLHLTTNRSTRLKHEDQIIKMYYEEMTKTLNLYGYSIEDIYPYGDLIECIAYMKPQMVMQAAIDCVLTMCTPEEISSFLTDEEKCKFVYFEDRTEFLTAMCQKSELYKRRLTECMLDVYDYCDFLATK